MTRYILMLILVGTAIVLPAQRNADRLIDAIKKNDSSVTMTLPGWLVRSAINAGTAFDELSEDEEVWVDMMKDIKKIRFSVVEEIDLLESVDKANEYVQRLTTVDAFELYAKVKSEDSNIAIMVREEKDKIKNILIYIHGDETLGAIHFKTDIDPEAFKKAKFSFNENRKNRDSHTH